MSDGILHKDAARTDPHARHIDDLDLTHGMHTDTAWRAWAIMLIGVALVALFNAQGLVKWTQTLPGGPATDRMLDWAFVWQDWTKGLGLADVFDAVREAFRDFRRG